VQTHYLWESFIALMFVSHVLFLQVYILFVQFLYFFLCFGKMSEKGQGATFQLIFTKLFHGFIC